MKYGAGFLKQRLLKKISIEVVKVECQVCGNRWDQPKADTIDCPKCHFKKENISQ